MTARAPIININHDPRFIALASNAGKAVNDRVTAFLAMGSMWPWNYACVDVW